MPPRAADLAGQLDVLLLKAARNVASGADAKAVEAAARSAGLPKSTVRKLLSLAEAAQKCVAKLDAFSGSQLAAAMVKNDDGSISRAQGSAAGKALGAAQAAQVKLSSALANALSKASDGNTQAALEELMLQCDRRVAEIETLALQMAEIVDKADGLAHFVKLMNVLRSTARAYVESPTPENKAKLENAAEVLMNLDREDAIDCLDQSFIKWAVPGKNASPEFKEALSKFKSETSGENGKRMLNDMAALVKRAYTGLDVAVAHLVELAGKLAAGPGNKVYVSSWVLGAFRGGCTVSSIVEARAHGYSDSDIDPRIDDSNVASYGILRTGLKTFKFPKGSSAHFVFHKTLNTLAASSGAKADFLKQVKKDPGIKTDVNGSIEIDLGKVVNRQLVQGLFHFCGLRSAAVPGEIDGELYDKLVALAPDAPDGGAARTEYLDALATRLGARSVQYKCAVKRLDDAIAHARKLKDEGKVYTAEQWETRDVQTDIATTALAKAKNHPDLPSASLPNAQAVKIRSDYIGSTNFFFRDFYDTVTRGGNRKTWFQ